MINSYEFWKRRVKKRLKKQTDHVCNTDIILSNMEFDQIFKNIKRKKYSLLELGCGNGLFLKKIINLNSLKKYIGIDFVDEIIRECKIKFKYKNLTFKTLDLRLINKKTFAEEFDYIISKKTIQSILNYNSQCRVIDNAGFFLKKNGFMILVESSKKGLKNINLFRKKFKLSNITPPIHNLFLDDEKIKNYNYKNIKLIRIENFSSGFYFVSRIIYALYSNIFLKKPTKYEHPLNIIASKINYNLINHDFSQIKTYIFKKI